MCKIRSRRAGLFSWSQSPVLEGRPINEDPEVENRNMIFISCIASVIMADWKESRTKNITEIITGFTHGYYDTTLNFAGALNKLFKAMEQPIKVGAPLIPKGQKEGMLPEQLINIARSLNACSLLQDMSWSCYYPQDKKPCGKCDPCLKREGIFTELKK